MPRVIRYHYLGAIYHLMAGKVVFEYDQQNYERQKLPETCLRLMQTAANSLTQAINEAKACGDIELLELIAKDPQAFIR